MSDCERNYRLAAVAIESPAALDEKVLQRARAFSKPHKQKRWLSRAASGCAAIAIAVLLIHPTQYLRALTAPGKPASAATTAEYRALASWQTSVQEALHRAGPWYELRTSVHSGDYQALCAYWREQQRGKAGKTLPADLAREANSHCRVLELR
ncbi:hypothetical protein Maes01_02210 [Microbulbifer aestuariivivens]|uniref:Uncharacterized protein n=1 Tax=Microbulbifer aestuariivivens TaxID=1908308 RepID=A0ABP9WTM9_9GAMM